MLRRIVACLVLALTVFVSAKAQRLEWSVDFNTVFDNREGDKDMAPNKTFFHTQLAPEIGMSMFDGQHRLMGGVVWTQPVQDDWHGKKLSPTLYYKYTGRQGLSLSLGMFPRTSLHCQFPNYVFNDSVNYFQHNIRGLALTYVRPDGFAQAVVDWRAMQSERRREAFNIVFQGEWQRQGSAFLAGGLAMMNHLAKSSNPTPDQYVVDNFVVNPYVGLDLSHRTVLDSLAVRGGALASLSRNREFGNKWKTPVGAWLAIDVTWWRLGWHNTFYAGGRLYPYYSRFGALLDRGEPYYQTNWYNRTTLYGTLINNKFINLQASLDFNVAKNDFTFYQRLVLRVYLDSNFKKLPKSYKLPSPFEL